MMNNQEWCWDLAERGYPLEEIVAITSLMKSTVKAYLYTERINRNLNRYPRKIIEARS